MGSETGGEVIDEAGDCGEMGMMWEVVDEVLMRDVVDRVVNGVVGKVVDGILVRDVMCVGW